MKKIFLFATVALVTVYAISAITQAQQPSDTNNKAIFVEEDYIATSPTDNSDKSADFQPLPSNNGVEVAPQPMAEPTSFPPQNQPMIDIEESLTTVTE